MTSQYMHIATSHWNWEYSALEEPSGNSGTSSQFSRMSWGKGILVSSSILTMFPFSFLRLFCRALCLLGLYRSTIPMFLSPCLAVCLSICVGLYSIQSLSNANSVLKAVYTFLDG